ncbi:MAG: sensor histidine kinase [Spirosomataceae bacterium]
MRLLLLILVLGGLKSQAQLVSTDSLKKQLALVPNKPTYSQDTTKARLLNQIAWEYCTPNADSAILLAQQSLQIAQNRKWKLGEAMALRTIGRAKIIKGNYTAATDHLFESLRIAQDLNNLIEVAYSYRYIGGAFAEMMMFDKAIENYNKALRLFELYGLKKQVANCLDDLGSIYLYQKNFEKALSTFERSLTINHNLGYHLGEGYSLCNMGAILGELGQDEEALKALRDAEKIFLESKNNYFLAINSYHFSKFYQKQKQLLNSNKYGEHAVNLAIASGPKYVVNLASKLVYENYKNLKKPEKALEYYEIYHESQDIIQSQDIARKVTSLQYSYETEKLKKSNTSLVEEKEKEKFQKIIFAVGGALLFLLAISMWWSNERLKRQKAQIELQKEEIGKQNTIILEVQRQLGKVNQDLRDLNQSLEDKVAERTAELLTANTELQRKNAEIQEALFKGQTLERKRVAAELHDTLGGTLAAVKLNMEYFDTKHLSDDEKEIYESVLAMIRDACLEVRYISHNLIPEELEIQGLIIALKKLMQKITTGKTSFSFHTEGITERLDKNIEFNLYTICLELINNILKHSQATQATISLVQKNGLITLKVYDNGVGIVKNGTGKKSTEGIGLKNIQSRVETLKGKYRFSSPNGKGLETLIEVPLQLKETV